MPLARVEIRVFDEIARLLHELAEAVERYARESDRRLREGQVAAVSPEDMSELTAAWNRVGEGLRLLSGAPAQADQPRDQALTIRESLSRVLEIVRRQTESEDSENS